MSKNPDPRPKRQIAKEYVNKQLAVLAKYGALRPPTAKEYERMVDQIEALIKS